MAPAKVRSLIKLLDDENESVRQGLDTVFLDYQGDLSDELAAEGLHLSTKEALTLSKRLHPGRQAALRKEWVIPFHRLQSPDGDWESLEALLRLLSDYLHDGVNLRPSLSDQLDLLAEDAENKVEDPVQLADHLFKSGLLIGNRSHPYDPRNSDLAWALSEGTSNPLGLCLIYMLVAHRLNLQVFGCNYPGHFLSLIDHEGQATLVDCFHAARLTPVRELIAKHPEISQQARLAIKQPCSLGTMLKRVLANIHFSFEKTGRTDDAELLYELLVPFGYDD